MMASKKGEKWIGPFRVGDLLDSCLGDAMPRPPESQSAYLVTARPWKRTPSQAATPLYVGGNTGSGGRFRTRMGDLLIDAFGFFTEATGHSSGGQSLHQWCKDNNIKPADLYIAWVEGTNCHRCLEGRLYQELDPKLNKVSPSGCETHDDTIDMHARARRHLRRSRR